MMKRKRARRDGSTAIYYAVDDTPMYLFMVERSLESLRRHNQSIRVYLLVFGELSRREASRFADLNVMIVRRRRSRVERGTFLKWLALTEIREHRVLFLDADTIVHDDPIHLFDALTQADFYAREELGTEADRAAYLIGTMPVFPQLDRSRYADALPRTVGGDLPVVFNTGVMLFNHGIHHQLAGRLDEFHRWRRTFADNPKRYPSKNWHIQDEIIASLVFSRLRGFRSDRLPRELSPWYIDWRAGEVPGPGVVIHTWRGYYPFYLRDFGQDEALSLFAPHAGIVLRPREDDARPRHASSSRQRADGSASGRATR